MNATVTIGRTTATVSTSPLTAIVQLATDGEHTIDLGTAPAIEDTSSTPTIEIDEEA